MNDTIIFWEDGNLASALGQFPSRALVGDVAGTVVIYGKEGRPQTGLTDLTPLLRNLQVKDRFNSGGMIEFITNHPVD